MRRAQIVVVILAVVALTGVAQAQKASGTVKCPKASASHALNVPEHPNHVFAISQTTGCTWTKPMIIGGVKTKEGADTSFSEINGDTAKIHGVWIDTMENGDQGTYRYEATVTMKDGVIQTAADRWMLTEGTGQLKGAKASGSCKGKGTPEGGVVWDCQGTFTLAKK